MENIHITRGRSRPTGTPIQALPIMTPDKVARALLRAWAVGTAWLTTSCADPSAFVQHGWSVDDFSNQTSADVLKWLRESARLPDENTWGPKAKSFRSVFKKLKKWIGLFKKSGAIRYEYSNPANGYTFYTFNLEGDCDATDAQSTITITYDGTARGTKADGTTAVLQGQETFRLEDDQIWHSVDWGAETEIETLEDFQGHMDRLSAMVP